ncbi:MAG: signal peptidase I [Clostridia bacterium]|nr:signal peptidase I [Clostridia bacterium]
MDENKNVLDSEKRSSGLFNEILEWTNAILLALLIALAIRGFLFEPVMVKGDSMNDTLQDEQRLIVYKLGYIFSKPQRGDMVVLQYQAGLFENNAILDDNPFFRKAFPDFGEVNYIKRAIALPGDSVDIRDGQVYVNGKKLDEPYAKGETSPLNMQFPVVVPKNKVFVLGDNRQHSSDSRSIGFIKTSKIKGKAVMRVYPLNTFGVLK